MITFATNKRSLIERKIRNDLYEKYKLKKQVCETEISI